jgi:hypothetical protein
VRVICGLVKDPIIAVWEFRSLEAVEMSGEFMKSDQFMFDRICDFILPELGEIPFDPIEGSWVR